MILIDTSAWVEFLRAGGRQEVKERVSLYLELDEAAVTGPVRFELLTGSNPTSESDVRALLGLCADLPFEDEYWEVAAANERLLRNKGITIPRDDLFIATVACERRMPLFQLDRHFSLAAEGGLDLQLLTV